MYPLFLLAESRGYNVFGSDREAGELVRDLILKGKNVTVGEGSPQACCADLLVSTLAASPDSTELVMAREASIPCITRPHLLAALTEDYACRIGVSGSHGKSTVTSLISHVFTRAGRDPTTVCGAVMKDTGSPLRLGGSESIIFEACEYRDAFLTLSPTLSVFTNLELDHVDYFRDLEHIKTSFLSAIMGAGRSIINLNDENLSSLRYKTDREVITVGSCDGADYLIGGVLGDGGYYSYTLSHGGDRAEVHLSILGEFNVTNSALAIAAACECGIPLAESAAHVRSFYGIGRRLELIGDADFRHIYYDYAHHPTEIRASIGAVREREGGRITVVFAPHTYSRTKGLFSEFVSALSLADRVLILDISAIRENIDPEVSSHALAEAIGKKASRVTEYNIISHIGDDLESTVIIMGAADVTQIKRIITENDAKAKGKREND